MAVGDAYVFPGFLTPVLTQLFFPKQSHRLLFSHGFCRGARRKYAGKKSRLNRGSNSQPQDHESDTLTTEPPRGGGALQIESVGFSYGFYVVDKRIKILLLLFAKGKRIHLEYRNKNVSTLNNMYFYYRWLNPFLHIYSL